MGAGHTGSGAVSYTDRLNVEAHLTQALRHLRTAEVMLRNLDVSVDLTDADRCELSERAASIGHLTRQIGDDLGDVEVIYDVREHDLHVAPTIIDRGPIAAD